MRTVIALLPFVGCAAGMYFCMRMMNRGKTTEEPTSRDSDLEVARMSEEVARLKAELRQRDREG